MNIQAFKPNPKLQEWIPTYVYVDANSKEAENAFGFVPPTNAEGMQIHLGASTFSSITDFEKPMPRYLITGRFTKSIKVNFQGPFKIILVYFHKGCSADFFQLSMKPFLDQDIDMTEVYPRLMREFDEKLKSACSVQNKIKVLDDLLLHILADRKSKPTLIKDAVQEIYAASGNITVKELAARYQTSHKTLENHFKENTGLRPKQYIDIARINFVLNRLKQLPAYKLNGLIGKTGYYDESHLIKHCKKLLKFTPKTFFKEHDQEEWFQLSPIKKHILNRD